MRLTLRTLLAYLDDTLEPAQAREIGQKVAESHVAQELIERIKRVTRRRGLTVPPATGPDKIDANTVAEYLDNDLSPELVAEVEEQALNSDVHLAEIAASHQILTLVLGEPAHVPPMARQRMYQLVKGAESDATRVAARIGPPRDPGESETPDDHHAARRSATYRLVGASVLAIALGVSIWQVLKSLPSHGPRLPGEPAVPAIADSGTPPPAPDQPPPEEPKPTPNPMPNPPATEPPNPAPAKPEPPKQPIDQVPDRRPNAERSEIGALASKDALVLVRGDTWTRMPPDARVSTGVTLLTLPGYHGEIRLDNGLRLQSWGTLPELSGSILSDVQFALHAPPAGYDLDLTLDRGRIYLMGSARVPTNVRVRFAGEVWDVTLTAPESELLVEFTAEFKGEPFRREGKGESPTMQALLAVLAGQATVKADARKFDLRTPPGQSALTWENKKAGLKALEFASTPPAWLRKPVRTVNRDRQFEIDSALRNLLARAATPNKPIELAIAELADTDLRANKVLAVLAAGALGSWPQILDALEDDKVPELRQAAVQAIQSLIARDPGSDMQVFDQLQAKLGYSDRLAEETMTLLHGFPESAANDPATFDALFVMLRSERVGERELAYWRLSQLDPEGAARNRFHPGDPVDQRERAIGEWRRRIPEGKLPPGKTAPLGRANDRPAPRG